MTNFGKQLEFTQEEKRKILHAHFPDFNMEEKRECIHCGSIIKVGDFRVMKVGPTLIISCPENDCDGTPLDWMPLSE